MTAVSSGSQTEGLGGPAGWAGPLCCAAMSASGAVLQGPPKMPVSKEML